MIYIHFIVNPIAGNGNHQISATRLRTFFPKSEFRIEVDYTKYKGHATELTRLTITAQPDYIVACGEDGTINEVASELVESVIKLGIVPVGSGNGLASHLAIPRNIDAALDVIKRGHVSFIDVGKVNERYFFSNTGIGVDAKIIKRYERSNKRTLWAYVMATLSESFKFDPRRTILAHGNTITNVQPFLFFISNSNEMGYKMSLTPQASVQDGKLDLFVVPKLSFFQKMKLAYCIVTHNVDHFKNGGHTLIQSLRLEQPETIYMDIQIDGEFHNLKTNVLDIGIVAKGLRVITDKK